MSIIERQQWAIDNGFQFSKTNLDPQLFLDKSPIPIVEETKFLGDIFDRKFSFVPHLKYVFKKRLESP